MRITALKNKKLFIPKHITLLILLLGLALTLQGCGFGSKQSGLGPEVAKHACNHIGTPYVYGGRSPKGFDCSGLVIYVFRQLGREMPDASWKQAKVGVKVSRNELEPGDLLFFRSSSGGGINHVGIYVGDNKMVHAPGKGRKVVKVDLNVDYYKKNFSVAKRIL